MSSNMVPQQEFRNSENQPPVPTLYSTVPVTEKNTALYTEQVTLQDQRQNTQPIPYGTYQPQPLPQAKGLPQALGLQHLSEKSPALCSEASARRVAKFIMSNYDRDKDQLIRGREIQKMLKDTYSKIYSSYEPTLDEALGYAQILDANNDGMITENDIEQLCVKYLTGIGLGPAPEPPLRENFIRDSRLDRDQPYQYPRTPIEPPQQNFPPIYQDRPEIRPPQQYDPNLRPSPIPYPNQRPSPIPYPNPSPHQPPHQSPQLPPREEPFLRPDQLWNVTPSPNGYISGTKPPLRPPYNNIQPSPFYDTRPGYSEIPSRQSPAPLPYAQSPERLPYQWPQSPQQPQPSYPSPYPPQRIPIEPSTTTPDREGTWIPGQIVHRPAANEHEWQPIILNSGQPRDGETSSNANSGMKETNSETSSQGREQKILLSGDQQTEKRSSSKAKKKLKQTPASKQSDPQECYKQSWLTVCKESFNAFDPSQQQRIKIQNIQPAVALFYAKIGKQYQPTTEDMRSWCNLNRNNTSGTISFQDYYQLIANTQRTQSDKSTQKSASVEPDSDDRQEEISEISSGDAAPWPKIKNNSASSSSVHNQRQSQKKRESGSQVSITVNDI